MSIANDRDIGGVYRRDGSFSTAYAAGSSLLPLFTLSSSGATTVVADTLPFSAGANVLSVQVADRAGNPSSLRTRTFTVSPNPPALVVTDVTGGIGASGIAVPIGLASGIDIAGLQFDLYFDPAVVASVDSVTAAGRAADFDSAPFNLVAPGRVRVLLFDNGGEIIVQGHGPVLNLWISLDGAAAPGIHTLTADDIVLADPQGSTINGLGPFTGTLTVP